MEKYLTKEQMQTILDSRPKGVPINDALDMYVKNGWTIQGVNEPKPVQEQPSLGSKLMETGKETVGGIKETLGRVATGETSKTSGALQTAGNLAGGALQATGDVLSSTPVVKDVVSAVAKPVSQGIQAFQGWLENNPTFQKVVTSDVADTVASVLDANPDLARNAEAINNIANAVLVAKGSVQTAGRVVNTAKETTKKFISSAEEVKNVVPKNLGQKAVDLVSADPEAKVATILKRSTPDEVSFYTNLGEKASVSGEALTPFEYVGNKLAETTKTLEGKLKEIGKAKSDIVAPMREGLSSFSKETKPLIGELTSLKNSFSEIDASSKAVVQSIINDAKTVSTKLDADKFIDKVQDALYTGNRNMTIVQGSAVDKQLRGIIGKYNDSLKKALPKEYGELNTRYSEMIDTLTAINRSLGEVVEGTPIRGAGLIKQYFSPSGSKAKEIFEFVKRETDGEVDLAKDATLAKFAMELFDDPRARSLLSGIGDIPTTASGVVSKIVEKVGGEKLQTALRESTIRKAKEKTLPKSESKSGLATTNQELLKVVPSPSTLPPVIKNSKVGVVGIFDGQPTVGNKKGYGLAKIKSDHPEVLPYIEEAFKNAKVVEFLPDRKILEGKSGDRVIRFIVDSKLGKENKTFLNNAYFLQD